MTEDDFVDGEIVEVIGELTEDKLSTIQWRTKDYKLIYIKDMEDKHLRNSALFLMGLGYSKCTALPTVKIAWLRVFSMEWKRRMIVAANGNKRFRYYPDSIKES